MLNDNASQTIVRQATPADLRTLVPLFEGYRQFYGREPNDLLATSFLSRRLAATDGLILLAVDGRAPNDALGFAQLYDSYSSLSCGPVWILNDLYVRPDARGRGVASTLLHHVEQEAKGRGYVYVTLSTQRTNHAAQRLYHKHGFSVDDEFIVFTLLTASAPQQGSQIATPFARDRIIWSRRDDPGRTGDSD
jgi:GNAT superfamily N-acetyltransferase